jgi:hypothetical protein
LGNSVLKKMSAEPMVRAHEQHRPLCFEARLAVVL